MVFVDSKYQDIKSLLLSMITLLGVSTKIRRIFYSYYSFLFRYLNHEYSNHNP